MSPAVIRKAGLEAVAKKLGPVGMVRFLQQFETGLGDYTKERGQWLKDMDIHEIVKEIKKKRYPLSPTFLISSLFLPVVIFPMLKLAIVCLQEECP
jgi:hypothetical protein